MAEAVFHHMVQTAGLVDEFYIDSAGISGWHQGERAHNGTLDVLRRNGILYNGRSRQVNVSDVDGFDYLLVMDRSNFVDMNRMLGRVESKVKMFLSYAKQEGLVEVTEVPDPYYTGGFDEIYDLVWRGCAALLGQIRDEYGLD
jgi:protein-tyrosine phosphatase